MLFSKFNQILENRIIKELTVQAEKTAEKARQNASWSKSIPSAIGVGKAEKTQNGYEVTITVDSRPDGPAPHAAAFEYGSGENRENGEKGKYVIAPKEATYLAFDWTPATVPWGSPKFFGAALESKDSTKGRYFFHFVEHPGVKPKPYLQPAIDSTRAGFVTSIARLFKKAYLDSTVKVTVIDATK